MPTPHAPLTHHLPVRPSWACRHCARLWPCPAGKGDLAVVYAGRAGLLLYYMSAQVVEFTSDLAARGELPFADDIYPRFIDWVRLATARAA
jgi:hypothetical protein